MSATGSWSPVTLDEVRTADTALFQRGCHRLRHMLKSGKGGLLRLTVRLPPCEPDVDRGLGASWLMNRL